ncbi:unnamed protein product [Fraxinus pennsylvanica]|uniref:HTH myb-type domain-containing protein n=1 Tax=Fraxinus pennsylvanica TaxID=56036 RepID=A0AAD2EAP2_9LAMI|nr:unnamed protein product [Fraxinus pennsylvanica]
MGENLTELNVDADSNFAPKIISDILAEVSLIDDFSQKLSKLDFHVNALEEELKKIDYFKRELPNCMLLLKDAIEKLKEEKLQLKGKEVRPVMEQFIPLKSDSVENGRGKRSGDFSDKKSWMSSAQLWSTPVQVQQQQQEEAPRKQRRYWSPELHQRFASALHQLGGVQATPKQIREVMRVDGLTNDEVKSHLQKYRLQIQKLSSSSAGVSSSSLTHGGSTNGGDHSIVEDEDKKSKSQLQKPLGEQRELV